MAKTLKSSDRKQIIKMFQECFQHDPEKQHLLEFIPSGVKLFSDLFDSLDKLPEIKGYKLELVATPIDENDRSIEVANFIIDAIEKAIETDFKDLKETQNA